MTLEDRYVNEKEVAKLTGRSVFTLRNDRHLGRGFPYVKNFRQVRYRLADILNHMEGRKIQPRECQS